MTPGSGSHGTPQPHGSGLLLWGHSLATLPQPHQLACLWPEELARAQRFAFERHRRRYLAARCALRERLAQHTGIAARDLHIAEGPFGKPYLAGVPGCHFNLSHSEDWALIGLSGDSEIGVDIEMLRPMADAASLAQTHFTALETAACMALEGQARDALFLRVWTRKEACLKAFGTGLSMPLRELPVGVGADAQATQFSIDLPTGRMVVELRSIAWGASLVGAVAKILKSGGPAQD